MNEDICEINKTMDDNEPIISFVSNNVIKTMRIKYEKWWKLMSNYEYKVCESMNSKLFLFCVFC